MTAPHIWIWSHPRSLSSALYKAFYATGSFCCHYEPGNTQNVCRVYNVPSPTPRLPEIRHSYNELVKDLHRESQAVQKPLLVKEHAWIVWTTQGNPANLAPWWRDSARHVMLVRDPRKAVSSFLRMYLVMLEQNKHLNMLDLLCDVYDVPRDLPRLCETVCGLRQVAVLHKWLQERALNPPLVLDASELERSPSSTMRKLTASLDLPWNPSYLDWGGKCFKHELPELFLSWTEHVNASNAFELMPDRSEEYLAEMSADHHRVALATIEQMRPHYDYLMTLYYLQATTLSKGGGIYGFRGTINDSDLRDSEEVSEEADEEEDRSFEAETGLGTPVLEQEEDSNNRAVRDGHGKAHRGSTTLSCWTVRLPQQSQLGRMMLLTD
eukprot:g77729.t1